MSTPMVLITPSFGQSDGTLSLRSALPSALAECGLLPVVIPYCIPPEKIPDLLSTADGLLLGGGGDLDPPMWGGRRGSVRSSWERDRTELRLAYHCLTHNIPVLGICRGAQVLAVSAGGTLRPRVGGHDHGYHSLKCCPDAPAYIRSQAEVNSFHIQAIDSSGSLCVDAVSSDGVPEAVRLPSHPFAVGLQWHPEYMVFHRPSAAAPLLAFAAACGAGEDARDAGDAGDARDARGSAPDPGQDPFGKGS